MRQFIVSLYIINKRLLFRWTYWIMLVSALMLAVCIKFIPKEGIGYSIALYLPKEEKVISQRIHSALSEKKSLFYVKMVKNKEEAISMVRKKDADMAWIVSDDWRNKLDDFARGKEVKKTFMDIYMDKDDIINQYSRELIYGIFYKEISYSIYESWTKKEIGSFTEEEVKSMYQSMVVEDRLFSMKELGNQKKDFILDKNKIFLSPIRGIFSLLLLLTAFLSMLELEEEKSIWLWMRVGRNPIFPYLYLLFPSFYMGVFILFSYRYLGIYQSTRMEFITLSLLQISSITLSVLLRDILKKKKIIKGILLPLLVLSLIFSPVFLEIKGYEAVKVFLPNYHYLESFSKVNSLIGFGVYAGSVSFLSFVVRFQTNLKKIFKTLISRETKY